MAIDQEILLTGLVGSNPLGALAAAGLLRICNEIPELNDSRLSWLMEDDWIAVLTVPPKVSANDFIDMIVKWQERWQERWPKELIEWNDIRKAPSVYKKSLIEFGQKATYENREDADFFSAFGSEMIVDGSKGLIKPTAFHMTSGRQEFLKIIREITESLRESAEDAFREALFGQWLYNDTFHSLGWDPATERMYALRYRAPTSEKPRCVRAAVWLGFQAIPLFPTIAQPNKKLATSGFSSIDRTRSVAWPIWTNAITLDALRSLLACSDLTSGQQGWNRLARRGISAVYRSVRSEFGQGYAILRPAELIFLSKTLE